MDANRLVQFFLIDHVLATGLCVGIPCLLAKIWIVHTDPSHPHYRGRRGAGVLLLCLAAAAASSSCATRGLSAKQTITIDVLQPSHDALAELQDFELATFNDHTLPALTLETHKHIAALLGKAFRDHAKATRAVRAWRAGDPVPESVLDLSRDVHDVLDVVKVTVPPTSRVLTLAQAAVDEAARVFDALQRGVV